MPLKIILTHKYIKKIPTIYSFTVLSVNSSIFISKKKRKKQFHLKNISAFAYALCMHAALPLIYFYWTFNIYLSKSKCYCKLYDTILTNKKNRWIHALNICLNEKSIYCKGARNIPNKAKVGRQLWLNLLEEVRKRVLNLILIIEVSFII